MLASKQGCKCTMELNACRQSRNAKSVVIHVIPAQRPEKERNMPPQKEG